MTARIRAVLDTSAIVLLESLAGLPEAWMWSLSSLSYAELAWGVERADGDKRARRQRLVAVARATLGGGLPFDDACAGHFGYLCHLTERRGRRPRGRVTDLQISAVAMRHGAVLVTANPADVVHLAPELSILEIGRDGRAGRLHAAHG